MENKVDSVDFKNSVNNILQEFTTTNYADILHDVYVCFDYKEVLKVFERIEDDKLDLKPVIHFNLLPVDRAAEVRVGKDKKAEKTYFEYTVYIVINENYQSVKPRYQVLNELSDELKYKFDNHRSNLDEFHKVMINSSEGVLGENANGLYASHQTLNFRIDKPLQ
ncbi:MAG: hypothetical protein ACLFT4_08090 [Bacteroidales bacterium]